MSSFLTTVWLLTAFVFSSHFETAFAQNTPQTSVSELEQAITDRIERVPEFKFIREQARQLGVKVYLFGGTASGFGHYVHWDLMREHGDTRFQPDRFDYDFTNIYRSNQDLDIVVDGPKEAIATLQQKLSTTFPHLLGDKGASAWEVRSLREDLGGTKIALLNNQDFLNQSTDSNSTGMIEITPTEHPVRDLFNWNSEQSPFAQDLAEGKIHYYDSSKHESTKLFQAGKNPRIMSAVRYLIKVVQFELEPRPEDLKKIQQIIHDFNPASAKGGYVQYKLEEIGKKLIQNAVNIEYSVDLITKLGLKNKLLQLSDPQQQGSMGWWINKEPLRSKPVGQGSGKTAKELGITMVAHETKSFMAWESMTRAHTGEPNVLISRNGIAGEEAKFGKGFYTAVGKQGARGTGTGINIRFQINPNAREGTDFILASSMNYVYTYVIFINKKAIRIIPESLHMGIAESIRFFASQNINETDQVQLEMFRRRINHLMNTLPEKEINEIQNIFNEEANKLSEGKNINPTAAIEIKFLLRDRLKTDLFISALKRKLSAYEKKPTFASLFAAGFLVSSQENYIFMRQYLLQLKDKDLVSSVLNQLIPLTIKYQSTPQLLEVSELLHSLAIANSNDRDFTGRLYQVISENDLTKNLITMALAQNDFKSIEKLFTILTQNPDKTWGTRFGYIKPVLWQATQSAAKAQHIPTMLKVFELANTLNLANSKSNCGPVISQMIRESGFAAHFITTALAQNDIRSIGKLFVMLSGRDLSDVFFTSFDEALQITKKQNSKQLGELLFQVLDLNSSNERNKRELIPLKTELQSFLPDYHDKKLGTQKQTFLDWAFINPVALSSGALPSVGSTILIPTSSGRPLAMLVTDLTKKPVYVSRFFGLQKKLTGFEWLMTLQDKNGTAYTIRRLDDQAWPKEVLAHLSNHAVSLEVDETKTNIPLDISAKPGQCRGIFLSRSI